MQGALDITATSFRGTEHKRAAEFRATVFHLQIISFIVLVVSYPKMISPESRVAGKKLLFRCADSCTTIDDFEQCVKDITSLTNLSPDMVQEARSVFTRKSLQPARQKPAINAACLKFWLVDIAVLIAIGSGLTSLWGYRKFVATDANSYRQKEAVADFSSAVTWNDCVAPPAQHPPISRQLFKVKDTVDVTDPNLDHPFAIPWRIVKIDSNQDGTLRFNLKRHVAKTELFMVIDNTNAETIAPIKPFSANDKAICEFNIEIRPCVILGKVNKDVPGGGVYRVSYHNDAGILQESIRPAWSIWRLNANADIHTAFRHPLAD